MEALARAEAFKENSDEILKLFCEQHFRGRSYAMQVMTMTW